MNKQFVWSFSPRGMLIQTKVLIPRLNSSLVHGGELALPMLKAPPHIVSNAGVQKWACFSGAKESIIGDGSKQIDEALIAIELLLINYKPKI